MIINLPGGSIDAGMLMYDVISKRQRNIAYARECVDNISKWFLRGFNS